MRAALRAALLVVAGSAAALLAGGQPSAAWDRSSAESTLWTLVNGARANAGIAPLQHHATLLGIARWRSSDMLERDFFSHIVAGTGNEVYHWYDLNGLAYGFAAENISWNVGLSDARSPVRAHERLMASDFHRGNVLNPAFTHGAVGAHGADGATFQGATGNVRVYTELFMESSGGAAAAPPPPAPATVAAPPTPPATPSPPWADAAWREAARARVTIDGGTSEGRREPVPAPAPDERDRPWATAPVAVHQSGAGVLPVLFAGTFVLPSLVVGGALIAARRRGRRRGRA